MNADQIRELLGGLLTQRESPLPPPALEDWDRHRTKFQCEFDPDFRRFIDLISGYHFVLETFTVISQESLFIEGDEPECASIEFIYDQELQLGDANVPWDPDLIPFCAVGNGDYYCLKVRNNVASAVFYTHHENGAASLEATDFTQWLNAASLSFSQPAAR